MADTLAGIRAPEARRLGPLLRAAAERTRWAGHGHRFAATLAALAVAGLPLMRPHGPGNVAPVDIAIVLTLGATLLWAGASGRLLRLPYSLAVAFTVFAGAISSMASDFPDQGLVALLQDVVLFAWAAAIANLVRTPAALRLILVAWAASAIVAAGFLDLAYLSGYQSLAGVIPKEGPRAALGFDDPNMAASFFVASLMVVLAARVPTRRSLRALSALVILLAIALTGSNGGILTLAVCIVILVAVAVRRRYGLVPAAAASLLAIVVGTLAAFLLNVAAIQAMAHESSIPLIRASIGRSAQSLHERGILISEATTLYQRNVLLGIGTNTYKQALADGQAPYVHEAHNDYVAAIVERGVLGLLGLLLLIGTVGIRTLGIVRHRLQPAFAATVPAVAPLAAAVAGFAVSAGFYQVLHFRHVWLMFGIVAGLFLWGRERKS